jgi:hypothetical protein
MEAKGERIHCPPLQVTIQVHLNYIQFHSVRRSTMHAAFTYTPPEQTDATAHHRCYPRAVRKTLRLATHKASPIKFTEVCDSKIAIQFHMNLIDPDMDITGAIEFGDYDDEFEGLTIVQPLNDAEAWTYLSGYEI